MLNLKGNTLAVVLALIAVLLWSTVATAFNIALKELSYIQLLTFSSGFSFLVLSFIMIIQKKGIKLRYISKNEYVKLIFKGLINPFAYYLILFKAYSLLPANEAMILNYTWPIILVVLSVYFLKQRLLKVDLISIFISFAGVIIIATKGNLIDIKFGNLLGVILALASSFFWAFYWILNVKNKIDSIVQLWFSFGVGFCASLIPFFIEAMPIPISHSAIFAALYVGLFEMSIPFILWQLSLNHASKTSVVSNLVFLSPFISLILIAIVLKEKILISSLVGFLMIILGNILHFFSSKKEKIGQ